MKAERRRLGEFIGVKHGFAFKGEYFSKNDSNLLLTPGNFDRSGGLNLRPEKDRSYDGPTPAEYVLNRGDVMIAMTDLTQDAPVLGATLTIPESGRYLHNQRLGKIIPRDRTSINIRYVAHLLNWDMVRSQIRGTATGSTVRHTSPGRIGDVVVPILPRDQQDRIAWLLDQISDLIEINLRRVRTLDRTTREYWLSSFQTSIEAFERDARSAKGWSTKLSAFCDLTMGQAPPSETYNDTEDGLPFHQGVGTFGAHFPIHRTFCTDTRRTARVGDVLFSVRAPVGRLNMADRNLIVGRGLSAIRHHAGGQEYLYHFLQHTVKEDEHGGGTIFKAVTRRDVEDLPWLEPSSLDLARFTDHARPMWKLIGALTRRNATLRALRDHLLPRLLSGELDVSRLPLPPDEPAAAPSSPPPPPPTPPRRGRRPKEPT